jgi:transcriptional regulator with XRE-family HTH domain
MPELNDDRSALAARLKEMREYLKLSQEEVAQMLKIPRSAISLIENGERRVEAVELKRFAEVYQCPLEHLTGSVAKDDHNSKQIAFLARAVSKLSQKDRDELLRFARFLGDKRGGEGK